MVHDAPRQPATPKSTVEIRSKNVVFIGTFSRISNKPLANAGTRIAMPSRSASVLSASIGTRRPADFDDASAHDAVGGPWLAPPSRAEIKSDAPNSCTQRTPEHSHTRPRCDEPHPDTLKIGEFRASSGADFRERAIGALATVAYDAHGVGGAAIDSRGGAGYSAAAGRWGWGRVFVERRRAGEGGRLRS